MQKESTPTEVSISVGEKLILAMLSDIGRHLKIKGDINPDFVRAALFGGHHWALGGLFDNHVDSQKDKSEVTQILWMWDFIERGYEKISVAEKERVKTEVPNTMLKFDGFDGNNESDQMGIAQFMINEMGCLNDSKVEGRILIS